MRHLSSELLWVQCPAVGKLFTINCIEKTNIKKKRPGMAHFKEQNKAIVYLDTYMAHVRCMINNCHSPFNG